MKITKVCKAFTWGVLLAACAMPAFAQTKLIDFEGLQDNEPIQQFYNGGTGGNGSGPGVNHGVSFSSNALALIDSDAGGSGNFGGEASPDTILYFVSGTSATLEVPAGFTTGFSFFYASGVTASVTVYDGPNATGNVLATITVAPTPPGSGDPTGTFGPFVPAGANFSGTARSVDFAGTANQVGFDNITLGASIPVGPPATTCASEGYTGPKLVLCKQVCEVPQSPARLSALIRAYIAAFREDPPCGR